MDVSYEICRTGSRYIGSGGVNDSQPGVLGSVDVEACRFPVGDSGGVVVDLLKLECFEPARGSGRHVSQPVVSVHHHRFVATQNLHGQGG